LGRPATAATEKKSERKKTKQAIIKKQIDFRSLFAPPPTTNKIVTGYIWKNLASRSCALAERKST
jgi:hypothetical protein